MPNNNPLRMPTKRPGSIGLGQSSRATSVASIRKSVSSVEDEDDYIEPAAVKKTTSKAKTTAKPSASTQSQMTKSKPSTKLTAPFMDKKKPSPQKAATKPAAPILNTKKPSPKESNPSKPETQTHEQQQAPKPFKGVEPKKATEEFRFLVQTERDALLRGLTEQKSQAETKAKSSSSSIRAAITSIQEDTTIHSAKQHEDTVHLLDEMFSKADAIRKGYMDLCESQPQVPTPVDDGESVELIRAALARVDEMAETWAREGEMWFTGRNPWAGASEVGGDGAESVFGEGKSWYDAQVNLPKAMRRFGRMI